MAASSGDIDAGNLAEQNLEHNPKWQLVKRIAASRGFSRAKQLQLMLLFVSRWAIVFPDAPLREHEIARQVLQRRENFDPSLDNIVRVQASHLRKRLEEYFEGEGSREALVLSLERGSYVPKFTNRPIAPRNAEAGAQLATVPLTATVSVPVPTVGSGLSVRWKAIVAGLSFIVLGLSALLWKANHGSNSYVEPRTSLLTPFLRNQGKILLIMPDGSLSATQDLTGTELTLKEYSSGSSVSGLANGLPEDERKRALLYLAERKLVGYNDAMAVLQVQEALSKNGQRVEVRYARDVHVQDFASDNIVLFGSPRSNLWVSLFSDKMNFRYTKDPATHRYFFENQLPAKGEESRYVPQMTSQGMVGYANIAILPNLSNSGHVLLVDGSDAQINDAAARFLIHGDLPASMQKILNDPNLKSFELLLRGKHISAENEHSFEIVTYHYSL